jgi:hypothetical protein
MVLSMKALYQMDKSVNTNFSRHTQSVYSLSQGSSFTIYIKLKRILQKLHAWRLWWWNIHVNNVVRFIFVIFSFNFKLVCVLPPSPWWGKWGGTCTITRLKVLNFTHLLCFLIYFLKMKVGLSDRQSVCVCPTNNILNCLVDFHEILCRGNGRHSDVWGGFRTCSSKHGTMQLYMLIVLKGWITFNKTFLWGEKTYVVTGWKIKFTFCFIGTTHDLLHLDKWSLAQ